MTNGEYVQVTQGGTTYKDESGEIVIKDGTRRKRCHPEGGKTC